MRALASGLAAGAAFLVVSAGALFGWFVMAGGAPTSETCGATQLDAKSVPRTLVPIFIAASSAYDLGSDGAAMLAGLTKVESRFGRNMGPSSAGAVGWTQFLPATWSRFGVDADGDGRRDPMNATDAIYSAANFLRHLGAPADWRRALYGYNHADWYVDRVLDAARALRLRPPDGTPDLGCRVDGSVATTGGRLVGGGRIVPIPGQPGETIDERIVRDVVFLCRRFRVMVTAGYARSGHKSNGEHPLGLAVDLVPAPGGSWDDVDALARWAEPGADRPLHPFRWVGYDGDPGHGRSDHLHLSWLHGPVPQAGSPASWVEVLVAGEAP